MELTPDTGVETASETIPSDIETSSEATTPNRESETNNAAVPGDNGATWGNYIVNTVSQWFTKKTGNHGDQSNISDFVPKSNDNVPSHEQAEQHFLTAVPPRTKIP